MRDGCKKINPVTGLDFPDPDVIRVGDTYYMVSTTMHFFPGGVILRSYDLVNWETVSYVYERLDDTPGQLLWDEENIYGQGMWAASLRWHKGMFYVCFVANDTHRTYLYTAQEITGPWVRREMEGFYHDCSLFFDDDDRIYIIYGNTDIRLTQLKEDLSGPMPGGLDRVIVKDVGNRYLGYEGSHLYKIGGIYYAFFIHSKPDRWLRTEACFCCDSLNGEFVGRDVLEDTMGYCGQGVAQGGIVDTPEGEWYGMLFQDRGAVGRIPVLMPVRFEKCILSDGRKWDFPVFGENGRVPEEFPVKSTRPGYSYAPLYESDAFDYAPDPSGKIRLKAVWQFNHTPEDSLWGVDGGAFWIRTDKQCQNLTQAKNTLTQRLRYPGCSVSVEVDISGLKVGDYAGLCALQGCYGMIAVHVTECGNRIVMGAREAEDDSLNGMPRDDQPCREYGWEPFTGTAVRLILQADFENMRDTVSFYYDCGNGMKKLGTDHRVFFKMDHFCGCRAGLFFYSTRETGGTARFRNFIYH